MFGAGFLLCIVAIGVRCVTGVDTITVATTTANPTPPTGLNFSCNDEFGTISITSDGLVGYSSIYATGTRKDNVHDGFLCDVIDPPTDTSYKFEIKNCLPDNPVTVYIMKVPSQVQQNSGSGFVIGGDGIAAYTLECYKEKTAEHLPETFKVAKKIEFSLSSTIATKPPEGRVYVDMSIRNIDGTTFDASTTKVLLGSQLVVLIKGPDGPVYRVEQCKAYSSKDENNTTTPLLTDKKVHHPELMSNFASGAAITSLSHLKDVCDNKFCIKSTLSAFRFKDDYKVIIQCTIDVCKSANSKGCDDHDANTFGGPALHFNRRKRESGSQQHVLKSTIVLQDNLLETLESASIGSIYSSPFYLIGTLAAVWVFRRFA